MTSWSATPMGSMTPVGLGMLHIRAAADWFNWRKVNLLFLNCALGGGGGERHFCKSSSLWGIFNKVLFVCSYSLLCVLLICDWLIDCFAWDFCSVFYWFLIDWLIVLQEILVLCIIDLWLIDCFAGYFCSVFYWFVIDWLIVLQEIFVLCFIDLWLTDWLFCRKFLFCVLLICDWLIDCSAGDFVLCFIDLWLIDWLIVVQEIFVLCFIDLWLTDWLFCRRFCSVFYWFVIDWLIDCCAGDEVRVSRTDSADTSPLMTSWFYYNGFSGFRLWKEMWNTFSLRSVQLISKEKLKKKKNPFKIVLTET